MKKSERIRIRVTLANPKHRDTRHIVVYGKGYTDLGEEVFVSLYHGKKRNDPDNLHISVTTQRYWERAICILTPAGQTLECILNYALESYPNLMFGNTGIPLQELPPYCYIPKSQKYSEEMDAEMDRRRTMIAQRLNAIIPQDFWMDISWDEVDKSWDSTSRSWK